MRDYSSTRCLTRKLMLLHVFINFLGAAAQLFNSSNVCIGATVNYTCTANALGHSWIVSSSQRINIAVTRSTPRVSMPPYSFMVTEEGESFIISTLSLTVFTAFNGTTITCQDSNASPPDGDMQTTTGTVFGECRNVTTV